MVVRDGEVGRYGGELRLTIEGGPPTFNPLLANESSSTEVIHGITHSSCWDYDFVRQQEIPGLCESFERSPDGLQYTFTLREGLRWSDGHPLTTADVEFSFRILADPAVPVPTRDLLDDGHGLPTFEKLDERRFRFTLPAPNVRFHSAVASVYFVPEHIWGEAYAGGRFARTMGTDEDPAKVVASGPFRLKRYTAGAKVVLERNPHYWKVDSAGNRLPYLDRLVFVVVPDLNGAFHKFVAGETDLHEVHAHHYEALERRQAGTDYRLVDLGPGFDTYWFMFNLDDGARPDGTPFVDPVKAAWFRDRRFRQAISHAIDREDLVRRVLRGRGVPLWGFYSPANRNWAGGDVRRYPYDLGRARALLTEAGFASRDGRLHDAGGHPVEFTVVTNAENALRVAMLSAIAEGLGLLGIEARVRPLQFNALVQTLHARRDFEAMLLGWGSGVPPDPSQSSNIMLSSGLSHAWHPAQEHPATPWERRLDELVQAVNSTADAAARKRHHDALLRLFSEELPQIMLVSPTDHVAARRRVGNFMPNALARKTHWNVFQLFLKEGR